MKNDILHVYCVDMTVDGYGVAKVDGLVIFVKGLIIEEEAMVKIIAHKKNLAYAIIDRLIKESRHRAVSSCMIAHKCGGCDLRHISYEFQLELKKKWLKTTLNNIAGIDLEVPEIIASPSIDGYRNKVQVPVALHKVGFYRSNSHDIVEYDKCDVQSQRANDVIAYIKNIIIKEGQDRDFRHIIIKEAFATGEMMVAFVLRKEHFNGLETLVSMVVNRFPFITSVIVNVNDKDTNVILGDKDIIMYGSSYIIDKLGDLDFKISLHSFYQINPQQAIAIYDEILKEATITKDTKVLDLYSGIGTIALYLARSAKEVVGVEVVKKAVEDAKDNALDNGIENASFYFDDAKGDMKKYITGKDLVVVDPPRKGLNAGLIKTLIDEGTYEIAYVSCNPATLARDLALFLEGGYKIKSLRGFDMFPYTTHIETVCILQKDEKNR